MASFEPGEMVRTPLDSVILTLKEMMGDDEMVTDVLNDCIEPPNMRTIERSYKVSLGAGYFSWLPTCFPNNSRFQQSLHESHFITSPGDDSRLTNLGSFALALGIDLTLGSLIGLGIQMGVGVEAIQMASIFSFPKVSSHFVCHHMSIPPSNSSPRKDSMANTQPHASAAERI